MYVTGKLDSKAKLDFEALMEEDPHLREKVAHYKQTYEIIKSIPLETGCEEAVAVAEGIKKQVPIAVLIKDLIKESYQVYMKKFDNIKAKLGDKLDNFLMGFRENEFNPAFTSMNTHMGGNLTPQGKSRNPLSDSEEIIFKVNTPILHEIDPNEAIHFYIKIETDNDFNFADIKSLHLDIYDNKNVYPLKIIEEFDINPANQINIELKLEYGLYYWYLNAGKYSCKGMVGVFDKEMLK